MYTTLTKQTWFPFGVFAALSAVFFLLLAAQEFLFPENNALPFVNSFVAGATWFSLLFLFSKKHASRLRTFLWALLFLTGGAVVLHFIVNVIDIYHLGTLPEWFYSLKLYRFVSLRGSFLVQAVVFILGSYLASGGSKKTARLMAQPVILSALAVFIVVIVLTQLQKAVATLYDQSIQMSITAHISFADRFTYKQGGTIYYGWIWPYSQFIIKHTPSDAVVMIPPQSNVWKMEGNSDYFRWFMYPRTLVHAVDGVIPAGTTHVLIALGECGEGDCGWPKLPIPAERIKQIILIDRETQVETVLTKTEYTLDTDTYRWGIIELQPL